MATLLEYYRLQSEEEKSWDPAAMEAQARAENPEFVEAVMALLPSPEEKLAGDLVTPLPSPLYDKMEALCRLYLSGTPEQRMLIRSKVDLGRARQAEFFGGQCAVRAMRSGSAEHMLLAVAAHAIENLKGGDVRDTLLGLTVVHYAAKTAGLDANALLREIALTAGAGVRAVLEDFADRHPDLQALEMMGWHKVETPEGLGFTMTPRRYGSATK